MPETRLVRVDLTGSTLGPAWRKVVAEVELPDGWTDTMLGQAASRFYGVPDEQVRVEVKAQVLADRGLHRQEEAEAEAEAAVPAIVIGGVHAR